ncbi:2Fe-2S iron-sulfur cluster binding domain-containing protein [Nitriliruptoraceae bacterium ZYF776]|nr:2Fe-2S iron-sulfur cluster binding domain-containing protein [Profundirhabdus halotolerans]
MGAAPGGPTAAPGAGATLAEVLRAAGRTEVKLGCERGECGACSVLVDGRPVHACTTLAALVDGEVQTAADLAEETRELRRELAERGGFQCGFCTPGHVVAAAAFLRAEARRGGTAEEADVRAAMNGNLCRCTGYQPIVDAIRHVHAARGGEHPS